MQWRHLSVHPHHPSWSLFPHPAAASAFSENIRRNAATASIYGDRSENSPVYSSISWQENITCVFVAVRILNNSIRSLVPAGIRGLISWGTGNSPMVIKLSVFYIFTALHVMQTRYCDENSVRPSVRLSVRLSVRHTRELWQNGRKICPDLYTIRKNI